MKDQQFSSPDYFTQIQGLSADQLMKLETEWEEQLPDAVNDAHRELILHNLSLIEALLCYK